MNATRLLLVSVGLLLLGGSVQAERKPLLIGNKTFLFEKGYFFRQHGDFLRVKVKGERAGRFTAKTSYTVALKPNKAFDVDGGWITGTYSDRGLFTAVVKLVPDEASLGRIVDHYESDILTYYRLFTGQSRDYQLELVKQRMRMIVREGVDEKLSAKLKFKFKFRGSDGSGEAVPAKARVKAVGKIKMSGAEVDW
ncbi:MAG: hypothetical protein ACYTDY_11500 [Planctomycetota bacterium]|jgi:hypothetical protein